MKIIQLIQKPQRRGAEIFAAQLSEQLRLSGIEVLLVSIFYGEAELPFTGEWIKLNRPISTRFFDIIGWSEFNKLIDSFQPDIIQANAADTLKFSVFSKRIFMWKTPIIYRNANQMGDFIRNNLHKKFNQWLINQVLGIVSVSKSSAQNLHSTFRFPKEKSIVIPIGIDLKEIDQKLKEKASVSLPNNYLIQIGGLVPEKDPLGMLSIFNELSRTYPTLNLVFLGSGIHKGQLVRKIKEFGLDSRVILLKSQTNIFPILSRARALVMPSKIEGLPGAILEAMYCKVPVIAFGVGGISEVLDTGKTGYCVNPGDFSKVKQAVKDLLESSEECLEQMTFVAAQKIIDEFAISDISNRFEAFYTTMK